MIGRRFGRLLVMAQSATDAHGRLRWLCRCDCGAERTAVSGTSLRRGITRSCGCLKAERQATANLKHGMSHDPAYASWRNMLGRCFNPNNIGYKDYGGRGITVCERWRKSFPNFLANMGRRPTGMTLDRIDSSQSYEPGNCRWATPTTQIRNRSSTIMVEFRGLKAPLGALAAEHGIDASLLRGRLRIGWPIEKALTTPVRKQAGSTTR